MSTAEAGQQPGDRFTAGELSSSEAVNLLNITRDEDWGWGTESLYSAEPALGLRRLGEDQLAIRLRKSGSTVLIVGNWDEAEDFRGGLRRVRRGQWKLPTQVFTEANADAVPGLVADLKATRKSL